MSDSVRGYPEITFVSADTQEIQTDLIAAYETITERSLALADPARLFILWVAQQMVQLNSNIDYSAKMNLPRYATGDYLDSLGELFKDCYRLDAEQAQTTLLFSLSTVRDEVTLIQAGTRVRAEGEIYFVTEENLEIPTGAVSGQIGAICSVPGAEGNGYTPGKLTDIVDVFPYFQSVTNTTESAGGADVESDDAYYERMRESLETYSTTGTIGAYAYWAKTASSLVEDVSVTSPVPGEVDIRFILEKGVLPGEEMIQKVYEIVNSDQVRTLTDLVYVAAPDIVTFQIDVTYYLQKNSAISDESVMANVEEAIEKYKTWQCEKMGRDINPSKLNSLLMDAGVKRVEINAPIFTVVSEDTVAQLGEYSIRNGGSEYE